MDALDAVGSVSSGQDQIRTSAVAADSAATAAVESKPVDAPAPDSDAVKVEVSSEEVRSSDEKTSKIVRDNIEEQAAQLEKTLNSKVVRFRVAVKEGDRAEMHFQVVDRETGKIVREFPPEKAHDFKDIAGLMLDKRV